MEELQLIADLCIKYNVLCISDEVYEWLVYDGAEHIRIGKKVSVNLPNQDKDTRSLLVQRILI